MHVNISMNAPIRHQRPQRKKNPILMNNLAPPRLDMCMKCTQSSSYFALSNLSNCTLLIPPFHPCCTRSLARADIILYVLLLFVVIIIFMNGDGTKADPERPCACTRAPERPEYNALACEKKGGGGGGGEKSDEWVRGWRGNERWGEGSD